MASGSIDVADVIKRLNKKLDEIEQGGLTGGEEEKQPDISEKPPSLKPVTVQASGAAKTIYELDRKLEEFEIRQAGALNIEGNKGKEGQSYLKRLQRPLDPLNLTPKEKAEATGKKDFFLGKLRGEFGAVAEPAKSSRADEVEGVITQFNIKKQIRELGYELQDTFSEEGKENGMFTALFEDSLVQHFDPKVGYNLSKEGKKYVDAFKSELLAAAIDNAYIQAKPGLINKLSMDQNLLDVEEIVEFVSFRLPLFLSPVYLVVTKHKDPEFYSLERYVLSDETHFGYIEDVSKGRPVTVQMILQSLIEASKIITNEFKEILGGRTIYPSIIYRIEVKKQIYIYNRVTVRQYGAIPYLGATSKYPDVQKNADSFQMTPRATKLFSEEEEKVPYIEVETVELMNASLLLQKLTIKNFEDVLRQLGYRSIVTYGQGNECMFNSIVRAELLSKDTEGGVKYSEEFEDDITNLRLQAASNLYYDFDSYAKAHPGPENPRLSDVENLRQPEILGKGQVRYKRLTSSNKQPVAPYNAISDLYTEDRQVSLDAFIPHIEYDAKILKSCAFILVSFDAGIVSISKLFCRSTDKDNSYVKMLQNGSMTVLERNEQVTGMKLLKALIDIEPSIDEYKLEPSPFPCLVMYVSGSSQNSQDVRRDGGHYTRIDPILPVKDGGEAPYNYLRGVIKYIPP